MPNHVMNRVSIIGDQEAVKELLESIQNDKIGIGSIDFSKIIPMPESLNIEAGSNTDKGLKAYTEFMQVYTLSGAREDTNPEDIPQEAEDAFLRMRTDISPEQWSLGRTAYENQSKYGAPTWYEWSINNWGTKWNAYENIPSKPNDNTAKLCFQTAWSAPHPVFMRLAEQYPELIFSHEWADEDIGSNCGRREYRDGCFMEEYYPEGNEATSFACKIWNIEALFDDVPETKELKTQTMTDEKFEVVEVLGQTALFTNGKVTQKELPDGLYKYDLREGETIAFATIEPSVAVNHAGTIITKEPIIFGEEEYIGLDDDSSPNFLGDEMSIEEFLNTDFSRDENESQTIGGMQL